MESILDVAACFNAVLETVLLLLLGPPLWTSLVAAVVVVVVVVVVAVVVVVVSPRPVLLLGSVAGRSVVVLRAGPIATPPRPRAAR